MLYSITTPEKWDSITRRRTDRGRMYNMIRLVMVDEVHTLKETPRGATLEAVITRMKIQNASIRVAAASATIGNVRDIAAWLSDAQGPATVHEFGDDYRAVPLKTVVQGFSWLGSNEFGFEKHLNAKYAHEVETLLIADYLSSSPSMPTLSLR